MQQQLSLHVIGSEGVHDPSEGMHDPSEGVHDPSEGVHDPLELNSPKKLPKEVENDSSEAARK